MNDWKEDILKRWRKTEEKNKVSISDNLRDRLAKEFRGETLYKESLHKYTSIRIGGKADVLLRPKDLEDLQSLLKLAKEEEIPSLYLGWGSNTLVKDGGVRGFVIQSSKELQGIEKISEDQDSVVFKAYSSSRIAAMVKFAEDNSLQGVEALVGIPGSIGGAISMNAGARGVEIKDFIQEIEVMTSDGEIETIPLKKLEFTYRHLKIPKSHFIISGTFKLHKGDEQEIKKVIQDYQSKRSETQPLNFPNLGSVFKNPPPQGKVKFYAAQLIEESRLKGIRVGGARVSEKHANFIINEKDAKAKDVLILINLIRDKVKEKTGILLETEIKIIGEDD